MEDIYKERHMTDSLYTLRAMKDEARQARLDLFLISEPLHAMTFDADISPDFRTNHFLICLALNFVGQCNGRYIIRFN